MKELLQVNLELEDTCNKATIKWSGYQQLIHSMAECGEYIASVGRFNQGRDPDLEEVTEEACDVIILMLQIRELVGHEKFDLMLEKKYQKFKSKVEQ